MIGIFIDAGAWNLLFEFELDLALELPRPEFVLAQTRGAEFEIGTGKPALDAYIRDTITRCQVRTDSYFGFFVESHTAEDQRLGGFDVGRFATPAEIAFLAGHRALSSVRPTGLNKHEADISLAARSLHSVVLTMDRRSTALRHAYEQGGKVLWLDDYTRIGASLADRVHAADRRAPI